MSGFRLIAVGVFAALVLYNCSEPVEPPKPPSLSISSTNLDFGTTETQLTILVSNRGEEDLFWSASPDVSWMVIDPPSGTNDQLITATVVRTGLSPGNYLGKINITSNGGAKTVNVSMSVAAEPVLDVTPTGLDFGKTQNRKIFQIQNIGTGTLTWQISADQAWIAVDPFAGSDKDTVTVTVNRAGLYGGDYAGHVFVTSNVGDDTVVVTMDVPLEKLTVFPVRIDFGTENTLADLAITNSGGGVLDWACKTDREWITLLEPTSGSGDGMVRIVATRSNLAGGFYAGTIVLESNADTLEVPATIQQTSLFSAEFEADKVDERPDTTLPAFPPGDYLDVREQGGDSVRVRGIVGGTGGLRNKPLELGHVARGQNSIWGIFSGGVGCDSVTVAWESLAMSLEDSRLRVSVTDLMGKSIGGLEYGSNGELIYNDKYTLTVPYVAAASQKFEIFIDFARETTTLSIDGVVAVEGADFLNSAKAARKIWIFAFGEAAKVFAIDNVRVDAGKCAYVPPL